MLIAYLRFKWLFIVVVWANNLLFEGYIFDAGSMNSAMWQKKRKVEQLESIEWSPIVVWSSIYIQLFPCLQDNNNQFNLNYNQSNILFIVDLDN